MAEKMTPGALMALAEENSRHHELFLDGVEQQLTEANTQRMLLEQDIIARLRNTPAAELADDPSLEFEVRQALRERQLEHSRLRQQLHGAERDVAQSLDAFRELQNQRETLDLQVRRELEQTPAYLDLTQQLQVAIEAQPHLANRYSLIQEECANKLPAFGTNPVYRYLRERKFDTPHYSAGRFNRVIDCWLARKVNFRQNHCNEQILLAMRTHVEDALINNQTQAEQLVERRHEQLAAALRLVGMHDLSIKRTLLAKQIVLAKGRADAVHDQLADYINGEDPLAANICQWLDAQLQNQDIDAVLEQVGKSSSKLHAWATRQRQTLRDLAVQLEALCDSQEQVTNTYKAAKELEWALRNGLFAERCCEAQCDCACHQAAECTCTGDCSEECECWCHQYCACDYDYDRDYRYQQTMDYEQLIATYMKGNLALNDLMQLFERQRAPLPNAAAIAHAPTCSTASTDCTPS